LYLSTAGGLTKTRPSYGIVAVAYALNATNNGKILVILHRGVTVDGVIPYTGFDNPDNVVSNYDPATQKITLSGTAILYYRGVVVFDLNAGNHVSSARTAGNGIWFYDYNGTSYTWSTTPWVLSMAMLGIVYKSATAEFGICEPHGTMPADTHRRLHEEIGTSRIGTTGVASGVVTGSTVAANRRPAFTASTIRDEDITTIIDAQTAGSYTRMHIGATNTTVFTAASADIVELAGSTPRVNNPADGSFTTLGNNEYMNVFVIDVPTMSDTGSKVFRRWFLNGQLKSTSRTTIDNQAISSLNLGDINPLYLEFVFAYRYLIRANASATDWTVISENRLTGNKVAQVSSVSAYAVALASLVTGGAGFIPFGDATGHTTDAAFKYVSSVLYAPAAIFSKSAAAAVQLVQIRNESALGYVTLKITVGTVDIGSMGAVGLSYAGATTVYNRKGALTLYGVNAAGMSLGAHDSAGYVTFFAGGFLDQYERMRINADGRVGIGLTASKGLLDVGGWVVSNTGIAVLDTANPLPTPITAFSFMIDQSKTVAQNAVRSMIRNRDSTSYAALVLVNEDGNNNASFGRIGATYSGAGYDGLARPKAFYANNSDGDTHFGTANGTFRLFVGGITDASIRMAVTSTGATLSSLAGTGSRIVSVDANGLMSATYVNPWRGSNLSAAPSSPVDGQFYSDTSDYVYVYANAAWRVLNGPPLFD
jgi:hypothetical protein